MESTPYEKYLLTFILKITIIYNDLDKIANVIYSQALHEKITLMTEKERDLVFQTITSACLSETPMRHPWKRSKGGSLKCFGRQETLKNILNTKLWWRLLPKK